MRIELPREQAFFVAREAAEKPVAKGKLSATIIIPDDFSRKIDEYAPSSIEVIVNPAETKSASIVTGIVKQVASEFALWGEVQLGVRGILSKAGILEAASPEESRAIEAQSLG